MSRTSWKQIRAAYGEIDVGLSVITIAELVHGAYGARTDADRQRRLAFVEELCQDVQSIRSRWATARGIGRIEVQQAAKGISLAFEDLAIGVTALALGFEIGYPQRPPLRDDPRAEDRLPLGRLTQISS